MILARARQNSFVTSLIVFVVWLLLLMVVPRVFIHGGTQSLEEHAARGGSIGNVLAPVFLLIAVAVLGWRRQVGLKRVESARSLLILWFPLLIVIAVFVTSALYLKSFTEAIALTVIHTLMVGFSEELMFRGVILYGALTRFSVWTAIIFSCAVFGSVHVLNGFMTGDFTSAMIQALTAAIGGIWFTAVRLHTKSIFPGMAIHALWDLAAFIGVMAIKAGLTGQSSADAEASTSDFIVPVLMEMPLFLYGLWFLRGIGKRDKAEFLS